MLIRQQQPRMGSLFGDIVSAVKSVGSTAVSAAKTVGNVAVQTAIAPVKYSTEAALDLGGTVISQFTPVLHQAANVASGAIQQVGQVGGQIAGSAAGAAQTILTDAGQAVSAAKGNTVAPPPPSNLPLYLGAAGAAGLLLFAILKKKSRQ